MRTELVERADLVGEGRPILVARHQPRPHAGRAHVTHAYAALAFCTEGRSQVEQRGRFLLTPGDVMLVPAGEPHRVRQLEPLQGWTVGLCVPCLASLDAGTLLEPFERVRRGASPVVHIPEARQSYLTLLLTELAAATASTSSAQGAVQRSLLTLVLHEVQQAGSWEDAAAAPPGVATEALQFIERNCLRRLTLQDVAEAVGRSPAYVTTALKRATGRSVIEWIAAGRMAEARRRLLHSDERVDVIAERVGYGDVTHFIRMFRREHGVTPTAWRAAQKTSYEPASRL